MRAWGGVASVMTVALAACGGGKFEAGSAGLDGGGDDSGGLTDAGEGDAPSVPDGAVPFDGGAPWSPRELPGLAVWLDASRGVNTSSGKIRRWSDQSGNGNDATGGNDTAIVEPGAANGKDAVACPLAGNAFQIADSPTVRWGTGGFVIAMVLKRSATTAANLWGKQSTTGAGTALSFQASGGDYRLNVGTSAVSVTTAVPQGGRFHWVIARGMRVVLQTESSSATGSTSSEDISAAGGHVFFCQAALHSVAEVIAVKGPMSDADGTKLVNYFKAKYAL
jgi:hypothetical protein